MKRDPQDKRLPSPETAAPAPDRVLRCAGLRPGKAGPEFAGPGIGRGAIRSEILLLVPDSDMGHLSARLSLASDKWLRYGRGCLPDTLHSRGSGKSFSSSADAGVMPQ